MERKTVDSGYISRRRLAQGFTQSMSPLSLCSVVMRLKIKESPTNTPCCWTHGRGEVKVETSVCDDSGGQDGEMRAQIEFLSYGVPLGVLVLDQLRGGCWGGGGRAGEMRALILEPVLTLGWHRDSLRPNGACESNQRQ